MSKKNNVILLLVTATPYSLVTGNSRIPLSNRIDWFSNDDGNDMYYGIKDYLHSTAEGPNPEGHGLLSLDEELETQITEEKESMLKWIPRRLASTRKDKENSGWAISRLKIIVLHYIQAMVGLYGEIKGSSSSKSLDFKTIFQWKIFNAITEMFQGSRVTGKSNSVFRRMVNINDQGNLLETGSMCLLRVLRKEDGMFIYNTLIRLRKVLGMEDVFSLIMDGDEKTVGSVGVVGFNKNETVFLNRLQKWRKEPDFRASQYIDLADLPVLLIVVEKGKMGITFPKSLRCYDLRLRYSSKAMVTRTCLEQDLGRVCQYKTSVSAVPDVQVYVSRVLYDTIKVRRQRGGIKSLDPDYKPDNMNTKADMNERYPRNESDFEPYNKYWCAGKDHYDHKYQNNNSNKN